MSRTANYGYDVGGGTIGVTAARSPVFASRQVLGGTAKIRAPRSSEPGKVRR
jgi:hypothetical protein